MHGYGPQTKSPHRQRLPEQETKEEKQEKSPAAPTYTLFPYELTC